MYTTESVMHSQCDTKPSAAKNTATAPWTVTEFRFYITLSTKYIISKILLLANLLASIEKTQIKNQKK